MKRKTPKKLINRFSKSMSKGDRKKDYDSMMEKRMNPVKKRDFDPETFDPMADHPDYDIGKRARVAPEGRLPTMGMKPKKLLEGQMVGMYESKQDLYLLIAHVQHELLDKIAELENEITTLKNKHKP